MTFLYLYIVRVTFFLVAMVFIPHFITRSNCSSSFAIMGGFERGVLGALFVTFFHFGSVYLRLAGEYDIPLLLFPASLEFIGFLLHFRSLALSFVRLADGLPSHLGLCG